MVAAIMDTCSVRWDCYDEALCEVVNKRGGRRKNNCAGNSTLKHTLNMRFY